MTTAAALLLLVPLYSLLLLLPLVPIPFASGWNIALEVSTQVSGAVGGEPFSTQPLIVVKDKLGELQSTFEGRVTVEIVDQSSMFNYGPYNFEPVWKEGEAIPTTASVDSLVSEDVAGGYATFAGLGINTADIGYQLKFVLYDEHGLLMGSVIGDEFDVIVGDTFQLSVLSQPEMSFGGAEFGSQPVLAVKDRGSNVVTDVNEGMVSVSLHSSPVGSALQCSTEDGFSIPITDGLAHFNGLFINKAGKHYSLQFSTDLLLAGQTEVISNQFSVGVGQAVDIVLINDASDGTVLGGKAFTPQPRLEIHDLGGNVLVDDSYSAVRISFYSNPSKGELSPATATMQYLEKGLVQFRGLSIDKAGVGYRLTYEFLQYEDERLHETSMQTHGSYFNVGVGPPHQLSILHHSSGGWAGNQPFSIQPKVALLDAGGNVVLGDSESIVRAHVTPSLAYNSRVIIDTSNDAIPSVTEVDFANSIVDDTRQLYGPGDVIQIDVIFSQEVTLFQAKDDDIIFPRILLNVIVSGSSGAVYGELVPTQQGVFSRRVSFEYKVESGHSQTELGYLSADSFHANDFSVEDALGRSVNLSLPSIGSGSSLSTSKSLGISDAKPVIESVTTDLVTGEYGAGHEINFVVTFDKEVIVMGSPELPLNVESSVAVIDASTTGTISSGSYFNVIYKGETSKQIPWNASASEVKRAVESLLNLEGYVCVSRAPSPNSLSAGGFSWVIRLDHVRYDISYIEVDEAGLSFSGVGSLSLNLITTDDVLSGWVSDEGDPDMCTERVASFVDGSGTKSLGFKYQVLPGDSVGRLDVSGVTGAAIQLPTANDELLLLVNGPGMSPVQADSKLDGVSLTLDQTIFIDTTPPTILGIVPQDSTTPSGLYAVGDSLFFAVLFDKPIVVDVGMELAINTEHGNARYVSGSGTMTLLLQYIVEEGDVTTSLDFEDLNALNTEGGRLPVTGHVRQDSTSPTTDANLDISHIASMSDTNTFVIDGVRPQMLDVSFAEGDKGETFERGDTLAILVKFSAPVVVNELTPPMLGLMVGTHERWATYSSGSGTPTLEFAYQVVVGDGASLPTEFQFRQICDHNKNCASREGLVVRLSATLELDANLSIGFSEQGLQIADSAGNGVTIDTLLAPTTTLLSATTLKTAGTYGVGEIMDILVHFSDQIFLSGPMPSLQLNVGNSASYYTGQDTDTLTFRYTSTESDSISQLDWALDPVTDSAIDCTAPCSIQNGNGVDAVIKFHDSISDTPLIGQLYPAIALDPSPVQIVSISTDKTKSPYCHPGCAYTAGEEMYILATFDRPIVVDGHEVSLIMNVGNDVDNNRAAYAPAMSTDNELVFLYTVGEGHSSGGSSLNYLCSEPSSSLQLGGSTSIKCAASIPTLDADLTLPPCSDHGISGDSSNQIIIDTSGQPSVIGVSSATVGGEYAPGDTIELPVHFDRNVEVTGNPFLSLDVGKSQPGVATYKNGSGTMTLLFEYIVGLDHKTLDLEYIDPHSLHLGHDGVKSGSIKQASTNPSVDANIDLPFSGTTGSLGTSSEVKIDSRKPFVESISSLSGEHSTGDKISIHVQFSRPISISGTPSLQMKAGLSDRMAEFESQPNDRTLEFSYTVQLGDSTESLEVWSDGELLPSSNMVINLNGGSIKLKSTNPVLDADLHINPIDGHLSGHKVVETTEGVALFRDLKIGGQRGKDYKIWYQAYVPSTGEQLQVAETVKTDASIEYEVQGDLTNRDPGDLFGSAVSLHNGLLAVGAPGKLNPKPEVQVLSVYSETAVEEHEIQIITTSVDRAEAIKSSQQFSTCADAGETISGSFTLTYQMDGVYAFASPIEFDSDTSAEQLKSILEQSLNLVGLIDTARVTTPTCESINSWSWSVTFLDSSSGVGVLETNGDNLTGNGSYISQSIQTRDVDMLRGSFHLKNPFNGLISRAISYNAPSKVVKDVIEEDFSIFVLSVQSENMDSTNRIAGLGRRWTVIFSHHTGEFGRDTNIPQLEAISDGLIGRDAYAWTHTGYEGRGVLSGSFALSFRGVQSDFVPHDSSEEDIAAALKVLDSINEVSVSNRRAFVNVIGKSGCTWTITFDSVNKQTDYGWINDPGGASSSGNLPTLEVASHLIGWNAGYIVQSETGRGKEDTQAQWLTKQKGDDGSKSGLVDVFRNVRGTWRKETTVLASDFGSFDSFGASVSIADDYLIVGAPSKSVNGLPEQQTMTCYGPATDGHFFVSFRGFTSSPIPYDATLIDIQNSILGLYGGTGNVHPTPRLLFTSASLSWDGISSGFCLESETTISITFLTPDGGGISTVEQRSGDFEMLTVDTLHLVGAMVSVDEHRAGTVAPMGKDLQNSEPTGKQSGSAYLFQRHISCSYCEPVWTQVMKFTPMTGLDSPTDAAEFGSTSIFVPEADDVSRLAIVGSPGFLEEFGKVYIFHYSGAWLLLDVLTDQNWNYDHTKGGRFGHSLDADSDTILVGSPGHSKGKGAVYVFRRSDKGKPFLASQAIYGPVDLSEGNRFGHSVSLHGNKAVICAPGKTTKAIHLSILPTQQMQTGACYVYSREVQNSAFKLDEQLVPSNVLSGDRFGWSVAMMSNRIVVGQVEAATGKITPPRPVQVVKTYCAMLDDKLCTNASASKLRLRWVDTENWSPYLSALSSANQMRGAIEASLLSGAASISRSDYPDEDGGHTWRITFDYYSSFFRDVNKIPAIQCEMFVTSSLSCLTYVEHDIPQDIRGKTHLFDFDATTDTWTEQAFLFPNLPQKQDLLGTSVAIDGNFAVAGAPNRELLNVNSGAALLFDIRFLNLSFPDGPYSLVEGDIQTVNVERSLSEENQVVSWRSMDPNAEDALQHYINDLFSLQSLDMATAQLTPVELLTGSTMLGRSQDYGSSEERSLFISGGQYDHQGISDYALLKFEGQLPELMHSISTKFRSNDDSICELNEHVTMQIDLKGMFASQLGRLTTAINIADNGDGMAQYQVLDGKIKESGARAGAAVGIDLSAGWAVVGNGQTSATNGGGIQLSKVGSASLFRRSPSGLWELADTLAPPAEDIEAHMNFGTSVSIYTPAGRDDTTVLVGASGAASAFVYAFQSSTDSWVFQAKLTANDAPLSSEDRFGGRGAIALNEDMAFVGSSTIEQVYVFRRSFVTGQGFIRWEFYQILRSSAYDYDLYGNGFSTKHLHQQGFGMAIATSKRALIVGAPFADYGNRGSTNTREHFDTDGKHNKGLGKGKVYSFYSQPHVQTVTLQSDEKISAGTFTLKLVNHQGVEDVSGQIQHDSSPASFKQILEAMLAMGEVNVEWSETVAEKSYAINWRITFLSSFADSRPLLIPEWNQHGCIDCDPLKVSVLSTIEPYILVQAIHSHQNYVEDGEFQPRDATSTDSFGASLALDYPQAIIGSMHSAAKTRTTWDFETGDLQGWSATGDAFERQPTFGDNSYFRAVYEGYGSSDQNTVGQPQASLLRGRYFLSSYEERPGSDDTYHEPSNEFRLGSNIGDEPTGTLDSDPFIILGHTISFLIGGGCNHLTVYVELLVDGHPALRATGKCSERMDRVTWDVSLFMNRAAQIQIVDNGSDKWEHIAVDEISFSWSAGGKGTCQWNNFGQCTDGAALPKLSDSKVEKQHYTGREETPTAGSAHMFFHECDELDFDDVSPSNSQCSWVEQERLVASDKREDNQFGISVDIDHEQGIAIVGSSNAPAVGIYNEPNPFHPHMNATFELPLPPDLENLMKSGTTYSPTGFIDYLQSKGQTKIGEAVKFGEEAGTAYVFLRESARYGPNGEVTHEPFWRTTEHSRIAPPDVAARDHFGYDVSHDGTTSIIGAIGHDGYADNGGSAFVIDMEWVRVKFSKVEFSVLESDRTLKIFVERDLSWSNGLFSIGYSTSDLTAVGVDSLRYNECMNMHALDRDGCGDYLHSSGEVTFNPGEQHAYFTMSIIDDKCIENHIEYAQLNLHQLGGSPLRGVNYRSMLRIDDDDWHNSLAINCTGIGVPN